MLDGNYFPISPQMVKSGLSLFSEVLGLELRCFEDGSLRFYNPRTGENLGSLMEIEEARRAEQQKSQKMAERLRHLGIDPDDL